MASGIYNIWKAQLMNKIIDMEADSIKVILLNNSHTFTSTNNAYTDISANELATSGGYTQNTKTLAGGTVTQETTHGKFDGTDVSWTSATFTAYHCVLYDDTPTSPADPLICSIDFGGAKTVTAGTFTITWDTAGIITIT